MRCGVEVRGEVRDEVRGEVWGEVRDEVRDEVSVGIRIRWDGTGWDSMGRDGVGWTRQWDLGSEADGVCVMGEIGQVTCRCGCCRRELTNASASLRTSSSSSTRMLASLMTSATMSRTCEAGWEGGS